MEATATSVPPLLGEGRAVGESSEFLLGSNPPRRSHRPIVGLSIRKALRGLLRSYRMQSCCALTFAVAYHLFHLFLLVVVFMSPLTARSLLFRDEDNAHYSLTVSDESGTRGVGAWTVDVSELTRNGTRGTKPWLHLQYPHEGTAVNTTSGDFFQMWEASPLSPLMYYYFYVFGSIFVFILLTGGRLNGYIALLQLIFGGMELLWCVRHNPSSSFTLLFWFAEVSSLFPYPWVPFAKRHPGGNITFHVFNRSGEGSELPPQQMELTPREYMFPHAATLEVTVLCTTVGFLVILIGCFLLNFQRVLDAVVGVRELAVADGHRRCPLCGEEWELSTETVEKRGNGHVDNTNNDDINDKNDNADDADDNEEEELGRRRYNALVGAAIVTALPLPGLPRPPGRHRCRRLFNDRGTDSSVFENAAGSCADLDSLDGDDGEEEEVVEGGRRLGAVSVRVPLIAANKGPQKVRKRGINRSFAQPPSYGTMATNEAEEGRPPFDPFPDREDEFRPGNAFSSFEDASWVARWTYSWLSPLMNFSLIDSEVLHHEQFLPSLPEDFTSLHNIATPAWQLWVNRWRWFAGTRGPGGADDPDMDGTHGEDGDDSSDDRTCVTASRRRPLTGAKLRPKRPRRSLLMTSFLFFTAPLRWALCRAFVRIFISEDGETQVPGREEVAEKKPDGSSDCVSGGSGHVDAPTGAAAKPRSALALADVGLFIPFLEHRSGRRFMYPCVPLRLLSDALLLSTPAIVYHLTLAMEREDMESEIHPVGVCAVLFLVLLGRAVLQQEYMSQLYLCALEVGTAIRALVLEKSLTLQLARRTFTKGEVIHLMTVDAARCNEALLQLHQSWRCPCFAAASLYILHMYVGVAPTLAALAIIIIAIPFQRVAGREVQVTQQRCTARNADRVELVGEAVASMRQVKAMGAEDVYLNRIHLARQSETQDEASAMKAITKSACFTDGIGVLLTSACYTAYYLTGGPLTARVVVPALVALNLLQGAVNEWPTLVAAIPRGAASLRRIETYLQRAPDEFLGTWVDVTADWSHGRGTVICRGCSFTWRDDSTCAAPTPLLRDVNMFLQPGELVVVQGPLGSGKSTLLLAVLGEVNRCSPADALTPAATDNDDPTVAPEKLPTDDVSLPPSLSPSVATQTGRGRSDAAKQPTDGFLVFGRSAYCPETPWLKNDTIRANIVLGGVYNVRWYQIVTQACALHEDFDKLTTGDEFVVGEKGMQLSAGQRVRVALARALYSRADVYVLDNVLASLDSRLRSHIIDRVFHGLLRNRTVILVTSVGLPQLDPKRLFTLREDGSVVEEDRRQLACLCATELGEPAVASESEPDEEDTSGSDDGGDDCLSNTHDTHGLGCNHLTHGAAYLRRFLSFMGPCLLWLLLTSVAQHVLLVGKDVWLSLWIATKPTGPAEFLLLYFLIGITAAMCTVPRMLVFFHAVRRSINHIHFVAIERMFRAPVSYFDVNVGSTITGIFSRDQETADHTVGASLDAITTGVLRMLAIALFNAVVNPWFLVIIPLLAMLFHHVVELYLTVAGHLRRLENRSVRGPVAILREVLEGASVIRCMGLTEIFREEYCRAMDVANTASMISHMAECWVSLRLELIAVLMATTAALLGVLFASYIMPPAFAAVAVVSCMQTSTTLLLLCRSAGAFQLQFVSVEQLLELQQAPEEPLTVLPASSATTGSGAVEPSGVFKAPGVDVGPGLPQSPVIGQPTARMTSGTGTDAVQTPVLELVNVSAKYRASLPHALRNVSLVIYERERVGIIGRSGNGKSTLFNVLLRLVDVIQGGGVYIRGINAGTVPYPALRRCFMLVLQDPLVMKGTWRTNLQLGIMGEAAEEKLWSALRAVRLDTIAMRHGGLDAPLHHGETGGSRLSPGQRQLFWLARAVLRKPQFLLFDELPGSGVTETESVVQSVLADELRDCTVLLIAHRVQTLETLCTRVVVMDQGVVSQAFPMVDRARARAAIKKKLEWLVE